MNQGSVHVFILASGSSRRMGGIVKQLLPVGGEPIIRRTIRLIWEYDPTIKIHVITWRNELKFDDVIVIDSEKPTKQMTDTILSSYPWWGDRNIFLVGDAIFGEDAIRDILNYQEGIVMFYRKTCPVKPDAERFTISFSRTDFSKVIHLFGKATRLFQNTNMEPCCGMVKICYATCLWDWLVKFTVPLLYTDGTHKYLERIRLHRDRFIFEIYYPWKPWRIISLQEIKDNITTDIDVPSDYEKFLALGIL